jgi:hypothetical protein
MTKLTTFTVTGRPRAAMFPLDMLRYDSCWPRGNKDVDMLQQLMAFRLTGSELPDTVSLDLTTCDRYTPARWASFGWTAFSTKP